MFLPSSLLTFLSLSLPLSRAFSIPPTPQDSTEDPPLNSSLDPVSLHQRQSSCPDRTLYPANLKITLWEGEPGGSGECGSGASTVLTGLYYAVSQPLPVDAQGTQDYRWYELSRDLLPYERVDFSTWGSSLDKEGGGLRWACGDYISTLHATDQTAKGGVCNELEPTAGVQGPIWPACLRVLDANSCQNEPEAGPNEGI